MFSVLFIVFYVIGQLLLLLLALKWLRTVFPVMHSRILSAIFILLFAALGSMMFWVIPIKDGHLKYILSNIVNYYDGILINTVLVLAVVFVIYIIMRLILRRPFIHPGRFAAIGAVVVTIIGVLSVYGFVNAKHVRVTPYEVTLDKKGDDMTVVLLADLHLGYNMDSAMLHELTTLVNAQKPDVICIAGDIFDNNFDALDNPDEIQKAFSEMKSTYGTYACWGNHDVSETLMGGFSLGKKSETRRDERMGQLLADAGVRVLEDESITVDDKFQIIGRLDVVKPCTPDGKRKEMKDFELNNELPIILLDHEPYPYIDMIHSGVDIELSGHTHDGQIFPGTLMQKKIWDNPAGMMTLPTKSGGEFSSIVTRGAGAYGPYMRTGTIAEICNVYIHMRK